MRSHQAIIVYLSLICTLAQGQEIKITPKVVNLAVNEEAVTLIHLAPGYATAVRMPEAISSVMVGDPAKFKAEHSEAEARLVFFKPLTTKPAESNALISLRSGQDVNLHLASPGTTTTEDPTVDFFVEYRRPKSLLIEDGGRTFFVPDTLPTKQTAPDASAATTPHMDWIAEALRHEGTMTPKWQEGQNKELLVTVGDSVQQGTQTLIGFSVVNQSKEIIELLPPQVEITGRAGKGGKQTRAEPIPLSEYRMTLRRLQPGERTDGVAVFERPAFKESSERLELWLARADEVDRPLLMAVPFIALSKGGSQ